MDAIIAQIHALAKSADEATRMEIQRALRQVQQEYQGPKEILMDLANSTLITPILRIGIDIGLLRSLASSTGPLTVHQLAETCNASAELLERILRYLASNNVVKEVECNKYQACNLTFVFASDKGEAMVCHGLDFHAPIMRTMPDYFKEMKYQNITSTEYTPFHKAFNTDLNSFDWLVQHPEHFVPFQKVMTSIEGSEWTEGFELLDTEVNKIPSTPAEPCERVFFVDVGGGHGHQSVLLRQKYPNLLGRLVLQDLPSVVKDLKIEGVSIQPYNFFERQPVHDAKFYYLRRIMHDWPDQDATKILQNIAAVMSSDSHILIDDAVLPNTGAVWQETMADLALMASCGGVERTTRQWESLADSAGLKVKLIHSYVASTYTAVVVLALK
ncbi:o-methyltransferase domain-containing protein [Penicillium hetheringtonii]|uniref:O-methyltransferase domain-containing protein n=1 Tax=Penicillium hetheringtonii TaxID=911720 RepID=A0AAD6DGH3_9EURO|nr:o-methyltransferase domain-containing protein [Penicillium hetheringtonii]